MSIKIITDSSSNFTLPEAKEIGVEIIPLNITFGYKTYKDGSELSAEEFYDKLLSSETLPKTSQPSPEDFVTIFEEAKTNNEEIIAILISSKLSGTIQSANIAKEIVGYEKIHIVDSGSTTIGQGILVEEAAKLRKKGLSVEEIIIKISMLKRKIRLFAAVDTLEYLQKGGRLSKTSAAIGGILNVKPILHLEDGKLSAIGKGYGTTRTIAAISKLIEGSQIDFNYPVYFGYNGSKEMMEKLISSTQKKNEIPNPKFKLISGVIGVHTGPGACAISYVSKE